VHMVFYIVSQKNISDIFDGNLKGYPNFNTGTFWYEYCWIPTHWPRNDLSFSYLTQCLFLHYLGKSEDGKCAL